MTHFNQLTPAEAERLAMLLEELGEAQQAIGKILRHGYESKHPNGGLTNRHDLEREIGDIHAALRLLTLSGDLDGSAIALAATKKMARINVYSHHQE